MDKKKNLPIFLLISVFIIATCGLIYELVAGALASYLLGDSVKQFSFIIGTYLFAMGVGSFFAKFIVKNLLDRFIDIELLIGIIGGTSSVILFLLFQQVEHFQLILYLFVFLTGCLSGMEIPLLMNILKDRVNFRDLVSNVFTFDYIGALIASVLFPILLIPKLGVMGTSLFFGIINVTVGIFLSFYLSKQLKNPIILKIKSLVCFIILIGLFFYSNELLKYSENQLYSTNVIYKHSTPYQRIVLTEAKGEYQLFLNNNLQFNTKDEYRYHETLVHPAMSIAKSPKKVLVLGGGDGLAVREILKYSSVEKVVLVDLDEGMTKLFQTNELLRKHNANALNNARVEVINMDAFLWVKEAKDKFDVMIIDFPDPSNYSLGKLYTNNFYKSLYPLMEPQCIVSVQTTSPYFAPKSYWCIYETIASVFPNNLAYHTYVPSFGEWGFNLFSPDMRVNFNRVNQRVPNLKYYNYNLQKMTDFPADMKAVDVEINRLDNQILVRYFDEEWSKI
ncbi:polyamine aminopropyltransferase 1 [Sphingobacterium faecium NBRC 15299]|jgi:spermidine synthase|uniref:polyamine aminopropyltransferase n=1 Tax=Sphingobacterium faecium TaxID=34087 RepID=UPI000D34C90D|nr:polyamine aminopropyltransferase [Sphingobacterium faecium]PTX09559.1 spermidine synthase [Sphingobacterium faecium]GEM63821.1 polyamine aminopropyltransferase 1 [Sphingobacterium faecium NBRC 15299]